MSASFSNSALDLRSYRVWFDLEGESGVVVRALGTALRLRRAPAGAGIAPPDADRCACRLGLVRSSFIVNLILLRRTVHFCTSMLHAVSRRSTPNGLSMPHWQRSSSSGRCRRASRRRSPFPFPTSASNARRPVSRPASRSTCRVSVVLYWSLLSVKYF